MSFKLRNTIALGIVLFLIGGGGFAYWKFIQPRQLKKAQEEIKRIERELQLLPQTIDEVKRLTDQFNEVRRKYDSRSKEVPASDVTSQTYGYMSTGIDQAGFFKFNMRYQGSKDFGQYGYNVYELYEGEAQFHHLYRFVHFLENGKRLYKINYLNISQHEEVDQETGETKKWLGFNMELHAYYTNVTELGSSLAAKALPTPSAPFNPFDPLIIQALATQPPPGAIDVQSLDVKAVLPGKAFVLLGDELIVLHLGDKVWRGYVSRISPQESKVEFTLDEGGIVRKIEKRIVFEDKDKGKKKS